MAQTVMHLTTIWDIQVQSLGQEDPLEKEWQPTPVFLPGEFHGQRSLVCYSPWAHNEADTTEGLTQQQQSLIQTFWQFLVAKLELPKA